MKRLFLKFLLSLCILLLGIHSKTYAYTYQDNILHTFNNQNHTSNSAAFKSTSDVFQPSIVKTTPEYKRNDKFDFTDNESENEEDDVNSFKKHFEAGNYFSTAFGTLLAGYFFSNTKKCLPSFRHLKNFPSCKWFILFRVIRI